MRVALLDTNVLLAPGWPNHQHHGEAHAWFAANAAKGWATCAFTQLGFIRLSSNPAYTSNAVSPREAADLLRRWTERKDHRFWDSPATDRAEIYARAAGHQQANDAWLVEAARSHSGRLVTLDIRTRVHGLDPADRIASRGAGQTWPEGFQQRLERYPRPVARVAVGLGGRFSRFQLGQSARVASASKPEMTSKSSSSMELWRRRW